jgi:large subunit ribosomal protein L21
MKYAIIQSGGKQYKVVEGGFVEVDKIDLEEGKDFVFEDVLLVSNDGVAKIGQPQVKGASVSGKIDSQFKGDKIRVAKFKAKARYRRVQGFRPQLTRIKIEKITL